jgi:hypothetical protein
MRFRRLTLDELTIDDEASFRHVALYHQLKEALRRSPNRFRVPEADQRLSWDRALFLNLTFWSAAEESSVLCDEHIAPDVVAHTAWHEVVGKQLARLSDKPTAPLSAAALLFSEAIASAFDLYLVGRLLHNAPDSDFIATQVPIMAEAAEEAGLSEGDFASLLESVATDPERAFEDMRALLVDAGEALHACADADAGQAALDAFEGRRFAPLLHHFQLSNWILYARAYARAPHPRAEQSEEAIRGLDRALRTSPVSLDWLASRWLSAGEAAADK